MTKRRIASIIVVLNVLLAAPLGAAVAPPADAAASVCSPGCKKCQYCDSDGACHDTECPKTGRD